MTKKIIALIPARMAATRFPNKPLAKILGLPMIEHVRRRAVYSKLFSETYVATCDEIIKKEVERYGGKAIMTKDTHERCTDRIEEAALQIQADIIVNIQGDEPVVMPSTLEKLISPFFNNENILTTNIINRVESIDELQNQNVVKAVVSQTNKILYMSRSVIPGKEFSQKTEYFKQTGLIAFQKSFLHQYAKLTPTPLEQKESCDMLRVLEHDYSIQAVLCEHKTIGVDIPGQIAEIEHYLMNNSEQKKIFEAIR